MRRVRSARPPADAAPQLERRRASLTFPCQVPGPDLWFADAPADLELAKTLCADCPARLECLAGALDRQEPLGVWGGQILHDGRIVTHKRPRGRPRKDGAPPEHRPALPNSA